MPRVGAESRGANGVRVLVENCLYFEEVVEPVWCVGKKRLRRPGRRDYVISHNILDRYDVTCRPNTGRIDGGETCDMIEYRRQFSR